MKRLKLVKDETKIDFMRHGRSALIGSGVAAALSVLALIAFGLNLGIDFRGGVLIEARLASLDDRAALPDAVGALAPGDATVQDFGAERDVLVVFAPPEDQAEGGGAMAAASAVADGLSERFEGLEIRRLEVVGPKVSGELIQQGVTAVVLAVLAVLFYIWIRFEWQFSVGAVAALVHDVALTVGIFALLQVEFNLSIIAALLTIVGYSLNDTVVVFDRVRENLRRYKTTPLPAVLNMSINETLSRTLMTSATTLLALFALYILGGEALRGLTFAMIFGVLVGTYSSIFVASPVLLMLGVKRDWDTEQDAGQGVKFG